jgi:hypothetical protein
MLGRHTNNAWKRMIFYDDSIHHIKEVYAELKREDAFLRYKSKGGKKDA